MHSAKEGHLRCVRILLKHGARVFAHVKGSTSKQLALNNGNGRIAELLADSEEFEIRNSPVPAYSRVYDPRSGSYYYYHNYTGITVRKKPANFDEDQTRKAAEMKKLAGQTSGVFGAGNSLPEPMRLLKVSSLVN